LNGVVTTNRKSSILHDFVKMLGDIRNQNLILIPSIPASTTSSGS
jgi:hypothetical protein